MNISIDYEAVIESCYACMDGLNTLYDRALANLNQSFDYLNHSYVSGATSLEIKNNLKSACDEICALLVYVENLNKFVVENVIKNYKVQDESVKRKFQAITDKNNYVMKHNTDAPIIAGGSLGSGIYGLD